MRRISEVMSLSLAALAFGGCSGSATEPVAAPSVVPAAREGTFDAGGAVQIGYRVLGTGADTLIVVHGGPGLTMDYLAADFEPFAGRHALILYDQRGTGRSSLVSDSTALDAQRFVDDLEALRRHFRLDRLAILGHSWGAAVAGLYAMRYPQHTGRLLIVGGIPLRRAGIVSAFEQLDASRDSVTRSEMARWREARLADPGDVTACRAYYVLWFRPFFRDSTASSRTRGDFCAGTPESRRNKIFGVDRFTVASLGNWDWRAGLREVRAPTLVLHGSLDVIPLEYAREWAATLPEGRLLVLDGIGHFPWAEDPDRFFAAVDAFLRGGWPAGAKAVSAEATPR